MIRLIASLLLVLSALSDTPPLYAQVARDSATVPLIVDRNRPYVIVAFQRPDGSIRTARFLLDTGGGGFLVTEQRASDRSGNTHVGYWESERGVQVACRFSRSGFEDARATNMHWLRFKSNGGNSRKRAVWGAGIERFNGCGESLQFAGGRAPRSQRSDDPTTGRSTHMADATFMVQDGIALNAWIESPSAEARELLLRAIRELDLTP